MLVKVPLFLALILFGAVFMYRAVRRQFALKKQQENFMMAVTHELKTPDRYCQIKPRNTTETSIR